MPYRSCRRRCARCIIFDLWHALLEDVAEAFKVVEIGGAEVLRHAAFDLFGELFGCCKYAVGRGDSGRCEVLVLVKNCRRDARGACIFHPHGPSALVVKRGAQDKALAAVFGKNAAMFGFVVDEGFHANGDEGSCVVVMGAVHVGVS